MDAELSFDLTQEPKSIESTPFSQLDGLLHTADELHSQITHLVEPHSDQLRKFTDDFFKILESHGIPDDESGRLHQQFIGYGDDLQVAQILQSYPQIGELTERLDANTQKGFFDELRSKHQELSGHISSHVNEAEQLIVQKRNLVKPTIDWLQVADHWLEKEGDSPIPSLLYRFNREDFSSIEPVDRWEILTQTNTAVDIFTAFARKPEEASLHVVEEVKPVDLESFFEEIKRAQHDLKKYPDFWQTYIRWLKPDRKTMEDALSQGDFLYTIGSLDSVKVRQVLDDSPDFCRVLIQKTRDMTWLLKSSGLITDNGEFQREIQPNRALSWQVTGLEEQSGFHQILTADQLSNMLLGVDMHSMGVPQVFLNLVKGVDFAGHNSYWDSDYQNIFNAGLNPLKADTQRRLIVDTVVHEVFEHVASQLSFSEMWSYENAIYDDKKAGKGDFISFNSRHYSVADDIPDEYRNPLIKKEDFCDTAMRFFSHPIELSADAPARYAFMKRFYLRHFPDVEKIVVEDKLRKAFQFESKRSKIAIQGDENQRNQFQKMPDEEFKKLPYVRVGSADKTRIADASVRQSAETDGFIIHIDYGVRVKKEFYSPALPYFKLKSVSSLT